MVRGIYLCASDRVGGQGEPGLGIGFRVELPLHFRAISTDTKCFTAGVSQV